MNDNINKIIDDLDGIYTKLSIEESKYSEEINNLRNRLIKWKDGEVERQANIINNKRYKSQ